MELSLNRTLIKNAVWFKAQEVARILGYKNTVYAIRKHVSEIHKRKIVQQREMRGCTFTYLIDEAGFYELVFKSRLPTAIIFREWVFTKVLPSIRKYGYYKMIDSRIKQRVIFDAKKYYKHPVFSNYAASRNGDVINVKTGRIVKMINNGNGYLYFKYVIKNLKNQRFTINIDLFTRFFAGQFHDF